MEKKPPPPTNSLKQDITINTRNVQQARGALNRGAQIENLTEVRKEFHLAVSSRATGLVRSYRLDAVSGDQCVLSSNDHESVVKFSSGTLTSDSRLVTTAHSNLFPGNSPVPPPGRNWVQDTIPFRVSFSEGRHAALWYSPVGASGPEHIVTWDYTNSYIHDCS